MIYGIFALMVGTFSVLAYSVYISKVPNTLKLLTLPLLVALGIVMGIFWYDSLGTPRYWKPTGEWTYVGHVTNGKTISLWLVQDSVQRLYVFPYEEETREELEKAKEMSQQGQQVQGEFEDNERLPNGTTVDGELTIQVKVEADGLGKAEE